MESGEEKVVTREALDSFAESFLKSVPESSRATIVGLSGELGAGKTAFVKALAGALGITDTVQSPTFVIEKIYRLPAGRQFRQLVHIDAYRLESANELSALGFQELLENPENLIVIEWPENVRNALPREMVELHFAVVDEETREISREI